MSQSSRNYHAHGGNEWVIGGKLTFLSGATIEGAEGLFDASIGAQPQLPNLPAGTATTVAALREEFNGLLNAMKAAGLMTPDAVPSE